MFVFVSFSCFSFKLRQLTRYLGIQISTDRHPEDLLEIGGVPLGLRREAMYKLMGRKAPHGEEWDEHNGYRG
jgi:hypothetical protein